MRTFSGPPGWQDSAAEAGPATRLRQQRKRMTVLYIEENTEADGKLVE